MIGASPRLSIGMAVYNGADHIRAALESLRAQTFTDFELVISDNGSTDGTTAIAREYAACDARIRLIEQPTNLGPARNFAYVLDAARAARFMFAAHDDLWEPSFAARLMGALDEHPSADLAFSRWDAIDDCGRHVLSFDENWPEILTMPRIERVRRFLAFNDSETLKALFYYGVFRTSVWREVFTWGNRYDAYAGSDTLMVLRMLLQHEVVFVDEVLFHNRIRPLKVKGGSEPLVNYVRERTAGRSAGHRGSAVAFLQRAHRYHAGIRATLREFGGFPDARLYPILARDFGEELLSYLVRFPAAILRELGLMRPGRLARAAARHG